MKHKYKAAAIAMSLVLAITAVIAANPATGEARVRLNKKKVTLTVGKDTTLKVLGTKKRVKWTSSNESVALVVTRGKNKGRIITLNPGKTRITAKVNKKKYRCTVTVKKKPSKSKPVRITPIPTVTPIPTAAPTVTPIPTATPIVTKAPDVNNNVNTITNSTLAANIETSLEKLPSGQVIAKVTNKNSVDVSEYALNFQFKDAKGTVLETETKYGHALSKGASQYVLTSAIFDTAEKTDVNKSQISVTADNYYSYLDGSADMEITAETTESRGVAVTFKNKSSHDISGYALIVFKDAKGKVVAIDSTSWYGSAGATKFQDVSAPTYAYATDEHQSYDDVEYAKAEVLNYSYYNSALDLNLDD